jgi:Holliday junction resolvase RusA-like endonuclease
MPKSFWYIVPNLNPVPWSSPSVSIGHKNGKPFPMVYAATEMKNYKQALKDEIERMYPDAPLIEDEIALRFFFWRRLDLGDKKKGRKSRGHVADATNLQKSTEDALQGVLFKNDIQVIHTESWLMEQTDETKPLLVVNLVWHPSRPALPDEVQARIDDHPSLQPMEDRNVHDVPEDIF